MSYAGVEITPEDTQQVKELKRQIINLSAQLDICKDRLSNLQSGSLLNAESIDLYPGEQLDFILSILGQVKERCPEGSRPRDIIESLLSVNKPVGRGQEILDELQRIFRKGYPKSEMEFSELKRLGFRYTTSKKHPKLWFMDKYMTVLSNTPGDNIRGAKNKLSEIGKCIAVSQKV